MSYPTMTQAPGYFHVLAKPTGAVCNLDCKYCFFLSKEALYPESDFRMKDDLLEVYIRQLLESQPAQVTLAWQGGEPTLMGLEFFQRVMELVEKHRAAGQRVEHTIQTNGTRLDDAWCEYFKEHKFLVGLSVDGPRALHDTFRVDKGGKGTFDQVMRGWELLKKHGVETNLLCTVHEGNAEHALEVYRFFRDGMETQFMQFIPIVERVNADMVPLANLGWGTRAGGERPLYVQAGDQVTMRSVRAVRVFADVRRCAGAGAYGGSVLLRPLCGTGFLAGEYPRSTYGRPGGVGATEEVWEGQAGLAAEILPGVQRAVCVQWGVSEGPVYRDSGRGPGAKLFVRRVQDVLRTCGWADADDGSAAEGGATSGGDYAVVRDTG